MSEANPTANRSELLRQRRMSSGRTKQPYSLNMARKPAKTQPVLVRNISQSSSHQTIRKSRQAKPRRQFYYSLGATGAELRLPALPMINPGWRVLSMLLVTLMVLCLYTLYNNPMFTVSKVDIVGLERIKPEDVEAVMDVNGLSIIQVQPQVLMETLTTAFPELSDIQVTVAFPANVGVTAHERQPKVSWQVNDQTYWIDDQGVLIPPRGEPKESLFVVHANTQPPLVPLPADPNVQTEETVNASKGKARASLTELATPVETTLWGREVDPTLLKAAEELRPSIPPDSKLVYNSESGLGWTDPRGWQVFVGRTLDNIDLKLVEYQAVVDALNQQGIAPSMISVEHLHAPFYRTEQ